MLPSFDNELAIPKFNREMGRVSNFNKSINSHHHMKDHVEIGAFQLPPKLYKLLKFL